MGILAPRDRVSSVSPNDRQLVVPPRHGVGGLGVAIPSSQLRDVREGQTEVRFSRYALDPRHDGPIRSERLRVPFQQAVRLDAGAQRGVVQVERGLVRIDGLGGHYRLRLALRTGMSTFSPGQSGQKKSSAFDGVERVFHPML